MTDSANEKSLSISDITVPRGKVSEKADKKTKSEESDWEGKKRELELFSFRQDIEERKKYAGRIFKLIAIWLIGIFVLLVLQGFSLCGFKLSNNVLIASIGGTTINVIGIFIIVVKYLFAKQAENRT